MNPDSKDIKFVLDGAVASIQIQDNLEASNKIQVKTNEESIVLIKNIWIAVLFILMPSVNLLDMNIGIQIITTFVIVMEEIRAMSFKDTKQIIVHQYDLLIFLRGRSGRLNWING